MYSSKQRFCISISQDLDLATYKMYKARKMKKNAAASLELFCEISIGQLFFLQLMNVYAVERTAVE